MTPNTKTIKIFTINILTPKLIGKLGEIKFNIKRTGVRSNNKSRIYKDITKSTIDITTGVPIKRFNVPTPTLSTAYNAFNTFFTLFTFYECSI
ncbi:hypothetical protein LL033_24555 (plasmid) [Clostridium estertheticum]|uniref:hypothetical protein n=1 Tax=Clostridium estertheticum TaxID=238834 RepID=UPI00227B5FE4|nr:hypothetical protein [Clostridium estertheticum]WAG58305.1 hypothetical protein LL033_24555 [Clostridium estertheticum]